MNSVKTQSESIVKRISFSLFSWDNQSLQVVLKILEEANKFILILWMFWDGNLKTPSTWFEYKMRSSEAPNTRMTIKNLMNHNEG